LAAPQSAHVASRSIASRRCAVPLLPGDAASVGTEYL
jgi:hypothetical protein